MAEENHEELHMEVAETWTLRAAEELLARVSPCSDQLLSRQSLDLTQDIDDDLYALLKSSMDVHLAPVTNYSLLETPAEARDALQKVLSALHGLGPRACRYIDKALRQSRSGPGNNIKLDVQSLAEAVQNGVADASKRVRPGPKADVPFGSASPRSKIARELALAYYRLTRKLPPTTHPDQRTSGEHPYHTLFREAFDLAGYGVWKKNAQKAAVWLRRIIVSSFH